MKIPATNETNLPGQNSPSNPATINRVASINNAVIGIPRTSNAIFQVRAQGHINGPLTCIQTNTCPTKNKRNENNI